MKQKILKQEKNPFLKREEFVLEITSESTPNESEIKESLGKEQDLTVVKKINTVFGEQKFLTEVVVYEDKESKEKVETIPQKVRKKMEAERIAAEAEAKKKAEEEKKAAEEAAKAAEEEKQKEEAPAEEESKEEESKE